MSDPPGRRETFLIGESGGRATTVSYPSANTVTLFWIYNNYGDWNKRETSRITFLLTIRYSVLVNPGEDTPSWGHISPGCREQSSWSSYPSFPRLSCQSLGTHFLSWFAGVFNSRSPRTINQRFWDGTQN